MVSTPPPMHTSLPAVGYLRKMLDVVLFPEL